MDKRDYIIVGVGVVAIICLVIFLVSIERMAYEDLTDLNFCSDNGYSGIGEEATINGIHYFKCCNKIVEDNEFVDDCKIFRRA